MRRRWWRWRNHRSRPSRERRPDIWVNPDPSAFLNDALARTDLQRAANAGADSTGSSDADSRADIHAGDVRIA